MLEGTTGFVQDSRTQIKSRIGDRHQWVSGLIALRHSTNALNHRRVPWLSYGFATVISFSRVTTSAHFPSDVFLGAALGYTITRYQVLPPR
jgi:putative Ca2+/H+ antiporter (TMEM165/GDT1 family)